MDSRVSRVIELMSEDMTRGRSTGEFARAVNLSASRLAYLFKKETSLTPRQFLKSIRLDRAASLLQTSFLTVKQIMAEVGWQDATHFQRDFRKAFSVSPGQYRRLTVQFNRTEAFNGPVRLSKVGGDPLP
jgi:transcriptional regulator GlxA family with amidase domain